MAFGWPVLSPEGLFRIITPPLRSQDSPTAYWLQTIFLLIARPVAEADRMTGPKDQGEVEPWRANE